MHFFHHYKIYKKKMFLVFYHQKPTLAIILSHGVTLDSHSHQNIDNIRYDSPRLIVIWAKWYRELHNGMWRLSPVEYHLIGSPLPVHGGNWVSIFFSFYPAASPNIPSSWQPEQSPLIPFLRNMNISQLNFSYEFSSQSAYPLYHSTYGLL